MNLKCMFLLVLLATNLAYNQTEGVTQIKSDEEFKDIITSKGPKVIAIGAQRNQFMAILFHELASIQGDKLFKSVEYYYALVGDIPKAVAAYNLHGLMVAVFNQGNCLDRIHAPIGINDLYAKLQVALG